jgi:hypothetical protein
MSVHMPQAPGHQPKPLPQNPPRECPNEAACGGIWSGCTGRRASCAPTVASAAAAGPGTVASRCAPIARAGSRSRRTRSSIRPARGWVEWFAAATFVTGQSRACRRSRSSAPLGLDSYQTAWMTLHRFRVAMVRSGRERLCGELRSTRPCRRRGAGRQPTPNRSEVDRRDRGRGELAQLGNDAMSLGLAEARRAGRSVSGRKLGTSRAR